MDEEVNKIYLMARSGDATIGGGRLVTALIERLKRFFRAYNALHYRKDHPVWQG